MTTVTNRKRREPRIGLDRDVIWCDAMWKRDVCRVQLIKAVSCLPALAIAIACRCNSLIHYHFIIAFTRNPNPIRFVFVFVRSPAAHIPRYISRAPGLTHIQYSVQYININSGNATPQAQHNKPQVILPLRWSLSLHRSVPILCSSDTISYW